MKNQTKLITAYVDNPIGHTCNTPLSNQDFVNHVNLSDICENFVYYYKVISTDHFINNKQGLRTLDHRVVRALREDRALLAIDLSTEGLSGSECGPFRMDLHVIDTWCDEINIPHRNVVYLTGNLEADKVASQQGIKINVEPVSIFEDWIVYHLREKPINFIPQEKQYLYTSLNRRPRGHRLRLINRLKQAGLLDIGQVSYWFDNENSTFESEYLQARLRHYTTEDTFEYFRAHPCRRLDVDGDVNPAQTVNLDIHESTFLHLNTETLTHEGGMFFTEKTWKPIVLGQPFMLLGNRHMLKELRNLGYLTFDNWWDESYDDYEREEDRITGITQVLQELNKKPVTELIKMREEMSDVLQHNIDTFKKLWDKTRRAGTTHLVNKPIYDVLLKHMIYMKTRNGTLDLLQYQKEMNLEKTALWVVMDPWARMVDPQPANSEAINAVNGYYAEFIHHELNKMGVENIVVQNAHDCDLYEKFNDYPMVRDDTELARYMKRTGFTTIVFVGFHKNRCIRHQGTEVHPRYLEHVKDSLTCALPNNWKTENDITKYIYDFEPRYGDHTIII